MSRSDYPGPHPAQRGEGHGQKALVLGAGPVGLLGALALLVRGFETWVYSREGDSSVTAQWVSGVGARFASSQTNTLDQLAAMIGNIDLVYEATGASALSFQTLQTLGVNGVFCFTGVPGRKAPVSIDTDLLMRNMVLKSQLVLAQSTPDPTHLPPPSPTSHSSVRNGRSNSRASSRGGSLPMPQWISSPGHHRESRTS